MKTEKHVVGFFNKVASPESGTITFSIVALYNGCPNLFSEHIKSLNGVKNVSDEYHEAGMGYWTEVTVTLDMLNITVTEIRNYIEKYPGHVEYVVDFFKDYSYTDDPDDWAVEWFADLLRVREYGLNRGDLQSNEKGGLGRYL